MKALRRGLVAALLTLLPAAAQAQSATSYRVVASYPHDTRAFTEGLFFLDGTLYESTGREGQSDIRQVRIRDGRPIRSAAIDPRYFGEGIVNWGNEILSLTWKDGIGFRWDRKGMRKLSAFHYRGEGWALTQDGTNIIMSDGSSQLRVIDPKNFTEKRRIDVSFFGRPLRNLNELEYVKGEIFANVWMTAQIVRIDPATGVVKGWIDLTPLIDQVRVTDPEAVPNGIAYDAKSGHLFVTGKLWPKMFEIALNQ